MMPLSTGEIHAALRERYLGNDYAYMTEVPNGTGAAKSRSCDAIAMSLWPSRGLEIIGHEIKASRSDWLRELKTPQKADEVICYCDRWFIVAGDKDIVKPGELPRNWGLLLPRGKSLVQAVPAGLLKPCDLDRPFVAGLLRAASKQLTSQGEMNELLSSRYHEGFAAGKQSAEHEIKIAKQNLARIEQIHKEFQDKSGIHVHEWNAGKIGEAVYRLMDPVIRHRTLLEVEKQCSDHEGYAEIMRQTAKLIRDFEERNRNDQQTGSAAKQPPSDKPRPGSAGLRAAAN